MLRHYYTKHRSIYMVASILCFLILSMVPVLSQETTPEPPVPTETPTLTPIPTNTETPTATMTSSPSPTPTFEVTSTETATLTATLTPQLIPSLPPTPIQIEPTMTPAGIIPMSLINPEMLNMQSRQSQSSILVPDGDIAKLRSDVASACGNPDPVTIELAVNGTYTFTNAPHNLFYPTALLICGNVTIIGNNSTLQRDTTAPYFRLIGVDTTGLLTLENVTLRDGYIDANGGAALLVLGSVNGGLAVLNNVRILNNDSIDNTGLLTSGAALYNYFGYLELNNVTIQNSNTISDLGGGAVNSWGGTLLIRNSRFINNTSSQNGGALSVRIPIQMELQHNEIVSNTAPNAGAVYFEGTANSNHFMMRNCVYNNTMTANPAFAVIANQPQLNAINNYWNGPASANANVATNPVVWVSPSDCTSQAAWDQILATPTPLPTLTPTPQPYKYGITDDGTGSWLPDELIAIPTGVANVAQSFSYLSTTTSTLEEAFNLVMLESSGTEILFIRTNQPGLATVTLFEYQYQYGVNAGQVETFSYDNVEEGYCITYEKAIVDNNIIRPAAVICNGSLIDHYSGTTFTGEADQYTVVHELGHLFDYRTGYGLSDPINNSFVLQDCSVPAGLVMGASNTGWVRGRRGWGTGPAEYFNSLGNPVSLVTDFQQNSSNIPLEAAADSFLNWVYRLNDPVNNGIPASSPCPSTTPWAGPGFLNMEWSGTPHPGFIGNSNGIPGTPDVSLPGDIRYEDIDSRIRSIFVTNSW